MKKINLGIIGAGAVAEVYHLPALTRMPEFRIKKIADKLEKRISRILRIYRLKNVEKSDTEGIFEDENIDAVLILTPPHTHLQLIKAAAKSGKHVFCEKPVVLNSNETLELENVIKNKKIHFMAGYSFRFIPTYNKMKQVLSSDLIGDLLSAEGILFANAYKWPSVSKFQLNRQGGGAFFEMGCHMVDLAIWFFGKPEYIRGNPFKLRKNSPIDDVASVYLEFESGVKCIINVAWNDMSINTFQITGSKGKVVTGANINDIRFYANKLIQQPPISIKAKSIVSPIQEELLYFYRMITKGKGPLITLDELKLTTNVMDRVYSNVNHESV